MNVLNTTARDIFLGEKTRRGSSLDIGRRGIKFPAGGVLTVPDDVQRSVKFGELVLAGDLVVQSYDSSTSSEFVHGEEAGGLEALITDAFTPTSGQTVFILSFPYFPGGFAEFSVNGISYTEFTILGSTATWTGSFSLDSGDSVVIEYVKA
jgi:hypothetical protein